MADKKDKKPSPLEMAVSNAYAAVETMYGLMENPNSPKYRRTMGELLHGKHSYYAGLNDDKIFNEAPRLQKKAAEILKDEKITYSALIQNYDGQDLVQLLGSLPPVEDKNKSTEEISKLHKKLYATMSAYRAAQTSKGKGRAYLSQMMAMIKDKDDQYLADNDDIMAGTVAYGQVQDAQLALLKAIYKIRPPKPEKDEKD